MPAAVEEVFDGHIAEIWGLGEQCGLRVRIWAKENTTGIFAWPYRNLDWAHGLMPMDGILILGRS
jgi:hypothetical protein